MPAREVITIDDPADPRLADYANLTDADLRDRERLGLQPAFIAEGEPVVRHLINSRFPVRSVLISPDKRGRLDDLASSLPEDCPLYLASPAVIRGIVGFPFHRGVLACGSRLPNPEPLALAASCRALVICEDLCNPDNVGAVFRNLSALGGSGCGVLLSPRCCDPLYRKAIRVSMGHALRIPFATLHPWPDGITALRDLGFQLIALGLTPRSRPLRDLDPAGFARPALLVGSEGPGLTESAIAAADLCARIPMAPGADSLNVAVALGVALAHLVTPR
ncbi:MAG: RNA methyltransferase [Leptolyngbya sp. PLA1]|nr:RNA methyltransferase [Leptolyngbya sp. PLA1]